MTSGYLFDSHALLAFFQNEPGANIVYEILHKCRKEHIDRLVCVINLGEIIYITKRMFGDQKKIEYWAGFISLDLRCCLFPIP
jgi:PIN domain nuclease of toxin-antitoxin system